MAHMEWLCLSCGHFTLNCETSMSEPCPVCGMDKWHGSTDEFQEQEEDEDIEEIC